MIISDEKKSITPMSGAMDALDDETKEWVSNIALECSQIYYDGIRAMVSHLDGQGLGSDEMVAIWSILNSKIRSAYKDQKSFELAKGVKND